MFVTPSGYAYWMRSVYNIDAYSYYSTIIAKYGSVYTWATQANRRLLSWGFNGIDGYSANSLWPVGVYGGSGNSVKLPFANFITPGMSALRNAQNFASEATKDIMYGIPTSTYGDYRSPLVDFYAPEFATYVNNYVNSTVSSFTNPISQSPWLLGWVIDDADKWYGLAGGGNLSCVTQTQGATYPHPSWMVAVTNFQQTSNSDQGVTYTDTKVYSKYALRDFLTTKYGTIQAMNQAWGSNYTTFDDAGGYGTGTGFLDENGQYGKAWIGTDWRGLTDAAPAVQADLNAFLLQFAQEAFSVITSKIRSVDPNHLIFGPSAMNKFGCLIRPQVYQAAAQYIDVFVASADLYNLTNNSSVLASTYDQLGKPIVVWTGYTANPDSEESAYPNPYGLANLSTQVQRGALYANTVTTFLSVTASDGSHPVIGLAWWDWLDSAPEQANWGLVTFKDNAYDGREAIIATGTDPWGYPTGGEAANYGDFLDAVRTANLGILNFILANP